MADTTTGSAKPGRLPPLSATGDTEGTPVKKKVVRKKKKPVADTANTGEGEEKKPTPRRRKAAASSSSTGAGGGETTTTPKKKKKVQSPKPAGEEEVDPASGRSGASQGEDVAGSKASLISKATREGTPRKKKVKKKVKKTPEATEKSAGEDFFDSTLAADLDDIKEDIVTAEPKKAKEYDQKPYSTQSNVLRSEPTQKVYIETDGGFKGETKIKFAKRMEEEEKEKAIVPEVKTHNTITFALETLKVFKTFCLFCHGLLAGFAAWQIVIAYLLLGQGSFDFLDHYFRLAMPVQCLFFFLLAVCTVSACDRCDIANPRRGFLLQAVTLQNGTVSVVIYFAALIISVSNFALEDKINLYEMQPMLWNVTSTMESDLDMWRDLNMARSVLSVLGWFVIAITPVADRLTENLKAADHIVSEEVELGKSGMA